MSTQRFHASRDTFTSPNGAIGHRPGGPFDCLGPFAVVRSCPIHGTTIRRTCYATGYADTWFSVPAATRIAGKHVAGYFTHDEDAGGVVFRPMDRHADRIPAAVRVGPVRSYRG